MKKQPEKPVMFTVRKPDQPVLVALIAVCVLVLVGAGIVRLVDRHSQAASYGAPAPDSRPLDAPAPVPSPADTMTLQTGSDSTLTATVKHTDGTPAVGVTITATSSTVPAPAGVYTATTDTTGVARITVTTGNYLVTASSIPGVQYDGWLLPTGWVYGPCGGSVPGPTGLADICSSAAGQIQYTFLADLVNATLYKSWAKANPGELARFKAYLAAPSTTVPVMTTATGRALVDVIRAYAYIQTKPLTLPAPAKALPPCQPGEPCDRTPPTAPTDLHVNQ